MLICKTMPQYDAAQVSIKNDRQKAEMKSDCKANGLSEVKPNLHLLPIFKCNIASINRAKPSGIYIGDMIYQRIENFGDFYATLGFRNNLGLMADEFVWERYTRDGAKKSTKCFQYQIAVYLHKHSAKFREQYGSVYGKMIGKCDLDCVDDDEHCVKCPLHPTPSAQ